MAIWRLALILGFCGAVWPQGGKIQVPGQIQKPKGPWQVPGEIQKPGKIQKPGEIQKLKEQCRSRLLVSTDTLFAFDKAELGPESENVLSGLGGMIRKEGKHPVVIEGHTDALGKPEYNQELSERRAATVEAWLVSHGILEKGSAEIRGFGKTKPIAANTNPDGSDNPDGRRKNRRVEVVVDTCK